jgi:hypothetical protein
VTILELLKNKAALCDAILHNHEQLLQSLVNEQWATAVEISLSLIELQEKIEAIDGELSRQTPKLERAGGGDQSDEIIQQTRQIIKKLEDARQILEKNQTLIIQQRQAVSAELSEARKAVNLLKTYHGNNMELAYWLDGRH